MVVLNPNNWHWVDKNTLPWSRTYFDDQLEGWSVPAAENLAITVVNISRLDGDSNVSQRKGKPICYFDLHLECRVEVRDAETKEARSSGSVSVPEFMHDEEELVTKVEGFDDFSSLVQKEFLPQFKAKLLLYQNDLIEAHSKDLQQT